MDTLWKKFCHQPPLQKAMTAILTDGQRENTILFYEIKANCLEYHIH
jgi:hypothetical protein